MCLARKGYIKTGMGTDRESFLFVIYSRLYGIECSTFFKDKGLLRFHRVYSLHLS